MQMLTNHLKISWELVDMEEKNKFTMGIAISVGLQTLEGLHSVGYLHRDIKPANFGLMNLNPTNVHFW